MNSFMVVPTGHLPVKAKVIKSCRIAIFIFLGFVIDFIVLILMGIPQSVLNGENVGRHLLIAAIVSTFMLGFSFICYELSFYCCDKCFDEERQNVSQVQYEYLGSRPNYGQEIIAISQFI